MLSRTAYAVWIRSSSRSTITNMERKVEPFSCTACKSWISARSLEQHETKTSTRTFSSSPNDPCEILYDVVPKSDFGVYKEYSVIHTNRSLNLMSDPFQKVMRDLNLLLKKTYNAHKVAIIPG